MSLMFVSIAFNTNTTKFFSGESQSDHQASFF